MPKPLTTAIPATHMPRPFRKLASLGTSASTRPSPPANHPQPAPARRLSSVTSPPTRKSPTEEKRRPGGGGSRRADALLTILLEPGDAAAACSCSRDEPGRELDSLRAREPPLCGE